ncbi:MAG TPA: glutamine-hydrolyzing GMP synthase [bacterium]|nr:glutamine-hydrolyzing GMP synthase [bacterium]
MEKVLILDFGSQYTMLIARRVRELKVFCEIHPCTMAPADVRAFDPRAVILSGGPASVLDPDSPRCAAGVFEMGVPVLGICYGLQLMAQVLGGAVEKSSEREYGPAELIIDDGSDLFAGIAAGGPTGADATKLHHDGAGGGVRVWMSHGDRIKKIPPGFVPIAHTSNSPIAAMKNAARRLWAVQFHPEVAHTPRGKEILHNFLFKIAGCAGDWTMESFITQSVARIKEKVGSAGLIMGLSGGVDSSVAAVLTHRAVADQLTCIFVDNGLLRQNEAEGVVRLFGDNFRIKLKAVDASKKFLDALKGIEDPEEKRKAIGRVFIEVFEEAAKGIPGVEFLGQGTLYPDVIESTSFKGPSATIKSHHNVGGLPERMRLSLVEPLRELFKDEVRELGLKLGLPDTLVWRQPFPGPGLAVRCLGEITRKRLEVLRKADAIATAEIEAWEGKREIWQYFTVLLPVRSVGVMGDERTYENVAAIRAVKSVDGMTADYADLPHPLLSRIASRIINEVKGINRVVYDISSKPPATIEWE